MHAICFQRTCIGLPWYNGCEVASAVFTASIGQYLAVNLNFCCFVFYFSDLNISENTTFVVHDGSSSGAQLLAKFEGNSSLLESSRTITSTQPWVYARWTGEAEGWNRVEVVFTEASKPGKLVILIWRHMIPHSLKVLGRRVECKSAKL